MNCATGERLRFIGYGNSARGDDGAGPLLLKRLQQRFADQFGRYQIDYIEALQLNPENAYDLHLCQVVIFLDADAQANQLSLKPVAANLQYQFSSHSQTPASVLALFQQLQPDTTPPICLQLGVPGYQFGLGQTLSEQCLQHIDQAINWLAELIDHDPLSQSGLRSVTEATYA